MDGNLVEPMRSERHTRPVWVESGCFAMAGGRAVLADAGGAKLLGAPRPSGLLVFTRIHIGTVEVGVEQPAQAPAADPAAGDVVAEISVEVTEPEVARFGEASGEAGPGLRYASTPGWHRLRCHASGQDYDDREGLEHSPEKYLIQAWPSDPSARAAG